MRIEMLNLMIGEAKRFYFLVDFQVKERFGLPAQSPSPRDTSSTFQRDS